jgi:hypothetical protein
MGGKSLRLFRERVQGGMLTPAAGEKLAGWIEGVLLPTRLAPGGCVWL